MLRILGFLLIPLAALAGLWADSMSRGTGIPLTVGLLIMGALLLIVDGRNRKRKHDDERHAKMVEAMRERRR